jgi:hypothetical protein
MSDQSSVRPINAQRRTLIWKWFLDPDTNAIPPGLTQEEILGVYGNSIMLLLEFRKTLDRLGGMYKALEKQEWKKARR